jgi:hypothetical protein
MMRIKNWGRFQHFKNRRPPWIKLYREILEDPEWHDLPDDAAKALVGFWLLASENCGNLPDVRRIAFRLRLTVDKTALLVEKLAHWLEADKPEKASPETPRDITVISSRCRDDAPEREGETERETETVKIKTGKKTGITGYDEIMNPATDPVDVACRLTGEDNDRCRGYWRHALARIGVNHFRSQLSTLWGEIQAGERPANPGACLTAKLKAVMAAKAKA